MAGDHPLKTKPRDARQHVTAGPYSPVLEVDARRLVVISGQVAIGRSGLRRNEGEIRGRMETPGADAAKGAAAVQVEVGDVQRNRIIMQGLA